MTKTPKINNGKQNMTFLTQKKLTQKT